MQRIVYHRVLQFRFFNKRSRGCLPNLQQSQVHDALCVRQTEVFQQGGFTTTWFGAAKKYECTTAFEYAKPLTLNNGRAASDEINAGFIVGRKLDETWRVGAGLRGTYKVGQPGDGDYVLKARALARYTFPEHPRWHFELIGDKSIATRNMPDEVTGAVLVRYNFGKKAH